MLLKLDMVVLCLIRPGLMSFVVYPLDEVEVEQLPSATVQRDSSLHIVHCKRECSVDFLCSDQPPNREYLRGEGNL